MLEELRKHYTETEIEKALDEWLDEAANYEPTTKDVAIVAAILVAPVVVAGGCMAIGVLYDKLYDKYSEYKAKKNKETTN